jgi:hypothetical protein
MLDMLLELAKFCVTKTHAICFNLVRTLVMKPQPIANAIRIRRY